jgi:hypothetical protein
MYKLYKLTYQDGTVEETSKFPVAFTGKIEYPTGSSGYCLNGTWHRDGGLPASSWVDDDSMMYWVHGKMTGRFRG